MKMVCSSPFKHGDIDIHNSSHSFSILSDDRSKASSKTIPPHSAI